MAVKDCGVRRTPRARHVVLSVNALLEQQKLRLYTEFEALLAVVFPRSIYAVGRFRM
jgi:hypothetical protein